MRSLSPAGQQAIADLAQRYGFSSDAVASMLDAVVAGNGGMAQFNHPEFGGSGQWMQGGMIMLSDMFNHALKGRVDGLCHDLARLVASQPDWIRPGSFQAQSQGGYGGGQQQSSYGGGQQQSGGYGGGQQQQDGSGPVGPVSLFVPPAPGGSSDWWGADLRWPTSTGAQNGVRYAYFAQARRLAIDLGGRVTVYDTLDHQISGFSQQQSHGGSLTFSSQYGLVDVASLPVLAVDGVPVAGGSQQTPQVPTSPGPPGSGGADIFALIERLAELRAKGILGEEEFATKKAELLGRL
jgi:hypothetical protein